MHIAKYFPFLSWVKTYNKTDLNSDVLASFITALLFIPQGMAYAMLAGLPVQIGLYASILPPLVYAFLGTSRVLSVGPVSIAAIMVASVLTAPEVQALGSPVQSAIILAAEGGAILLFMALLGMGGLVNFISHPVLSGFTSAASILIVFSQLPHLLGLTPEIYSCHLELDCAKNNLQNINLYTMGIGLLSIIILFIMGTPLTGLLKRLKINPLFIAAASKSAPLIIITITTIIVSSNNLHTLQNVPIVGNIPLGLPELKLDFLAIPYSHWATLFPSAFFISLIAYVESVAIAKVAANLRNQKIEPNQELIALGASNIATAISGGMPVAGGFSRTMVNYSAGARSQIATIITVIIISLAVLYLSQLFSSIPKAALASIILVAIIPLIKFKEILTTWRIDMADGVSQLITFTGVLVLGIEEGIALGVLVTIINYLRRSSQPHIAVVGRLNGTEQFRNIKRHKVETWDSILLVRIDENITFTNIGYITNFIDEHSQSDELEHIVLVFSSVSHIDTSALHTLENFILSLEKRGVLLHIADVKGPVMDTLDKTDFLAKLSPGKVYFHTSQAIESLI